MTAAGFLRARVGGLPRSFWVLWSGTLVNRLGTMVVPFLALYLTGARGLSLAATGVVLAVHGAGSVVAQLTGGVLADRLGRRGTLITGMLGSAVTIAALGFAYELPLLIAAAFLFGIAIDLYRPAAQALLADLVPPADRPRAFGLLFWAINLGFAVATMIGGSLARQGYVWLFLADGVTCLLFAVLVWRFVPETRAPREDGQEAGSLLDVVRDRTTLGFIVAALGYAFVLMQAFSTLPLAVREAGLSAADFGFIIAVNGVVIVVVQPLVSGWLGRFRRDRVLIASLLLMAAGWGATAFAESVAFFVATVVVWTLGEIANSAAAPATVADLAPPHLRGRYSGAFGIAFGLSALLSPLVGTRLLEIGPGVLWGTSAVVCLAAALLVHRLAPEILRRVEAAQEAAERGRTTYG